MAAVPWRLLRDDPADGAWNMAVDEALAEAVGARASPPTLRLYGWRRPTVSLGYLQRATGVDLAACAEQAIPLVRRPTGGRAVLHHRELTYSLTLPLDPPWAGLSVAERFRRLSAALVAALARLGVDAGLAEPGDGASCSAVPAACFALRRMPAIVARGRKLAGSAARCWEGVLLQHGSLLLEFDARLHRTVFPRWAAPERDVVWLEALLPAPPSPEAMTAAFVGGCADALGARCVPGARTPAEERRAAHLLRERYAGAGSRAPGEAPGPCDGAKLLDTPRGLC